MATGTATPAYLRCGGHGGLKLVGDVVVIACRLAQVARAGEVLSNGSVLAAGHLRDRVTVKLKGFPEIRVVNRLAV